MYGHVTASDFRDPCLKRGRETFFSLGGGGGKGPQPALRISSQVMCGMATFATETSSFVTNDFWTWDEC
jgi:hypothetical protein